MSLPTVSAVVVGRNVGQLALPGLLSLLDQTVKLHELVFVDDGSTDATADIVEELSAANDCLRVIRTVHSGLTDSLIVGCQESSGETILRQDVLMRSMPGRVEAQLGVLERSDRCVLATCWTELTDPEFKRIDIVKSASISEDEISLFNLDQERNGIAPTCHGSVLFRRDAYDSVGGYRREFRYAQDLDLWLRLIEQGSFSEVSEILCVRPLMIAGNSLLRQPRQARLGELAKRAAELRRSGESEATSLALAQRESTEAMADETRGIDNTDRAAGSYFIGACMVKNDPAGARRHLRDAMRLRPWHVMTYVQLARTWLPTRHFSSQENADSADGVR